MHESLSNLLSYQHLLPLERETVFPDASAGMPLASRAAACCCSAKPIAVSRDKRYNVAMDTTGI